MLPVTAEWIIDTWFTSPPKVDGLHPQQVRELIMKDVEQTNKLFPLPLTPNMINQHERIRSGQMDHYIGGKLGYI